jgi:hypothetical protein
VGSLHRELAFRLLLFAALAVAMIGLHIVYLFMARQMPLARYLVLVIAAGVGVYMVRLGIARWRERRLQLMFAEYLVFASCLSIGTSIVVRLHLWGTYLKAPREMDWWVVTWRTLLILALLVIGNLVGAAALRLWRRWRPAK